MSQGDNGFSYKDGVSLKDYFEDKIKEFDRLNDIRFRAAETAVGAALSASDKLNSATFAASKEAIVKAEDAQKAYNIAHNDISRKMDDQYKLMVPRSEWQLKLESVDKEISSLRESRSENSGKNIGIQIAWGIFIAVAGLVVGFLSRFIK